MIKPFVTPAEAAQLLNEAWAADPRALEHLLRARVVCNETLANHPTIQVMGHPVDGINPEIPQGAKYAVGLLGLINGMFGTDENGVGPIQAMQDDTTGDLKGFHAS
jgi:hypothetical protein